MLDLLPGDLVVVRTSSFFARIIRFGEWLQRKPDMRNHVAVLHHTDAITSTAWFLEGRPAGLGWRIERIGAPGGYLSSKATITNARQPKTDAQRAIVTEAMEALIGKPYDWAAIEADAAAALHLPELWAQWNGRMPGHVVCSSSAAWAYEKAGLTGPQAGGGRFVEPADWDLFITTARWPATARS